MAGGQWVPRFGLSETLTQHPALWMRKQPQPGRWHLGGEGIRCVGYIQILATVSAGGECDDRQGHGTFQML